MKKESTTVRVLFRMLETIIGNILCVWYNIAVSVLLHGIRKEKKGVFLTWMKKESLF